MGLSLPSAPFSDHVGGAGSRADLHNTELGRGWSCPRCLEGGRVSEGREGRVSEGREGREGWGAGWV